MIIENFLSIEIGIYPEKKYYTLGEDSGFNIYKENEDCFIITKDKKKIGNITKLCELDEDNFPIENSDYWFTDLTLIQGRYQKSDLCINASYNYLIQCLKRNGSSCTLPNEQKPMEKIGDAVEDCKAAIRAILTQEGINIGAKEDVCIKTRALFEQIQNNIGEVLEKDETIKKRK